MFGKTTDKISKKSRVFFWITLILYVVGFLMTIVGVCFPFWQTIAGTIHAGIFQLCLWTFKGCTATHSFTLLYKDVNYIQLLWGLAIAGMFLLLLALIFLVLYPLCKTVNHCKIATGIFVSVFLLTGVALILCAVIIYIDYNISVIGSVAAVFRYVGFAWYLTVAGLLVLVISFVCFVLHMFFMVYDEPSQVYPDRDTSWRKGR